MGDIIMKRDEIIDMIKNTLKEYGIQKAFLFGSFARKEKKYHDIDVVIEPPKDFSFLDLAHVENVLEDKTRKKFDVLTFGSLSRHLKPYIEKDLVQII
jgi:hypothetical protein